MAGIRDFITVLVICKFEKDAIKSEGDILLTKFSLLKVYAKKLYHSRASNFDVNSPIWLEIELFGDFITVFVSYMLDEDPTKNDVAILRTTFSSLQISVRFRQDTNWQVTPKSKIRSGWNWTLSQIYIGIKLPVCFSCICLFVLYVLVCLFLLVLGVGCRLRLWHSLYFFSYARFYACSIKTK